jgi:hypothetical protein
MVERERERERDLSNVVLLVGYLLNGLTADLQLSFTSKKRLKMPILWTTGGPG